MSDWIEYAERQPETAGAYRWRLPSTCTPGLFVTFLAHMRLRGAGYQNVVSPSFDYWDGYRLLLPQGVQWQAVESVTDVKWHGYGEVTVEGVEPCACPYCEKVPVLKGAKRYNDGTMSHGASPHEYSSWWLECCAWSRTPHFKDPRDLVARRNAALGPIVLTNSWIKCSDTLPEQVKGDYLIVCEGGEIALSEWIEDGGPDGDWGFWYDWDATHWQPLPAPPTE